jgi:hypothetical protein
MFIPVARDRRALKACEKAGEESVAPVGSAPKLVGKITGEVGAAGTGLLQVDIKRRWAVRVEWCIPGGNKW